MAKINLTVQELVKLVGGSTSLNQSFLIKDIKSLELAQSSDLAVLFDPDENTVFTPVSLETVKTSKAGLIIASSAVVSGKPYMIVEDPIAALGKIETFIKSRNRDVVAKIHERACIGEFAVIEDNVDVGPYAVIENDAKIGFGAVIGANVFIGQGAQIGCGAIIYSGAKILERCVIGDNTIVHPGAVIGSDGFGYRVTRSGLNKVPHVGIVRIGAESEIGANTTIDRGVFDETIVGDGVKIDNCVHLAHNVKIGNCTVILAQTGIAGSAHIGAGCQIGGQVAIKDHVKIGNFAKIVSKSAVMRDVDDRDVVCGIPSIPFSQWKRMTVILSKLPEYIRPLKEKKQSWWSFFKK